MPYVKPGTEIVTHLFHFEAKIPPRVAAPYFGIYRCTNCAYEIVSSPDNSLPDVVGDPKHEKFNCSGLIKWQLVALAMQKPE